ncbi:hypothetical protein Leryth_022673 [Lithospermum erythrorhizon]|nr:hypothetical protein Leryth_022673 [Lithospermum erythrorhizon]
MATATSSSDASEGPVLNLINKRLRALRKKQNRINQMEESLSKGKTLNKEQQDTLNSKQSILGAIEELDRLLLLVPCAVSEELKIRKEIKNVEKISVKGDEEELRKGVVGNEETTKGFVGIEDVRKGFVGIEERPNGFVGNEDARKGLVGIEELLELVYFGSLFDVKTQSEFVGTMFRKIHERGCCLSYDCVTDDDEGGFRELLTEGDLDLISMLGRLLIERPVDSGLSHKNALERCVEHAKLWVSNSEQPIVPHSDITCMILDTRIWLTDILYDAFVLLCVVR